MIALSPEDVVEYSLVEDQGESENQRTVFQLGSLPARVQRKVQNLIGAQSGSIDVESQTIQNFPIGDFNHLILCGGIRGWRNINDSQGRPVLWRGNKDGSMEEDLVSIFTMSQQAELAQRILVISHITDDDRKN